jgi:hypothetical protein
VIEMIVHSTTLSSLLDNNIMLSLPRQDIEMHEQQYAKSHESFGFPRQFAFKK